jgi:type I restriction enzyme M protein
LFSVERVFMDQAQLSSLTNFIWNIADDILRDVYVRGKYRDVILPMTVLRRLDAVLEPTKQAVLDMKAALDREKVAKECLAPMHPAPKKKRRARGRQRR